MLRKLGSPRKGSRFAAASPSGAKQLSPLDVSASAAEHGSVQQAQSPATSPKKRMSLWSKKAPTSIDVPSANDAAEKPSEKLPVGVIALPQVKQEPSGDHKFESPREKPSPLKRSPRRRSVFEAEAKATSPKPQAEEKKKARSKRDSFALKSLVAKREKAGSSADEKPEKAAVGAEPEPSNKATSSKPKDRESGSPPKTKAIESVDLALSPIRRARRPSADSKRLEPSTATTTIREATSLLNRKTASQPEGVPPTEQPEVHIIGEIVGGDGFGKPSDGYCCKWSIDYGNQWIHVAGDQVGQTQIDYSDASAPDEGSIVWAHPLDLHFATIALHGWPKLLLQVWRVDSHMKMNVVGYGFVHLPFTPGHHQLSVSMWRPMGSSREELAAALLGHTPELASDDTLFNTAWAERCRLKTIATGQVHLSIGIIVRNLEATSAPLKMES